MPEYEVHIKTKEKNKVHIRLYYCDTAVSLAQALRNDKVPIRTVARIHVPMDMPAFREVYKETKAAEYREMYEGGCEWLNRT